MAEDNADNTNLEDESMNFLLENTEALLTNIKGNDI
jgi:hypothetical protein